MRSLRGRLTLGVAVILALVLTTAGFVFSRTSERNARAGLDDQLRRTATLLTPTAVDAVANQQPGTDRRLNAVLSASESSLRLQVGKVIFVDAGRRLLTGPVPQAGLRTVRQDGRPYRSLVIAVKGAGLGNLARLEVTTGLSALERRQSALDRRLLRVGLLALLVAILGTLVASGAVLGPLRRLRRAARRVTDEEDLSVRVSESDGPGEVRELATSINAMLAQIETASAARERALAATRRFALDAGHEIRTPLTTVQANLSALHRHPDVPAEQRQAMLADALDEQRRLVNLLDGLQAYARGEVSSVEHEPVDLAEVVAAAATEVARRYAAVTIATDLPEGPVVISGWSPGLRLLAGNLMGNAARHGPPQGTVRVALSAGPDPVLTVDDEGAGVPAADRERIFTPFERLADAAGREGTGLGLALVAQQVREHGALIAVEDAPGGGARFTVSFVRAS